MRRRRPILNDVNMIDPFHLEAYGETTVNYNRDVEIFPVLAAMFEQIYGECPYKSPTDMGVNMAGYSHHRRRSLPRSLASGGHAPLFQNGVSDAPAAAQSEQELNAWSC